MPIDHHPHADTRVRCCATGTLVMSEGTLLCVGAVACDRQKMPDGAKLFVTATRSGGSSRWRSGAPILPISPARAR
jgi:hypothetical protein